MKKFFYLAGAAMFLASCSSESEKAVVEQVESQEGLQELVEIKLGSSRLSTSTNTQTRAANEISNATTSIEIGVFAIDEATTVAFGDTAYAGNGITDYRPVILSNVPATIDPEETEQPVNFTLPLDATHQNTKWYYPRQNGDYNYTFFGYYPYITGDPEIDADNITITGPFDGSQDVMAGRSASIAGGYNAKYYRDNASATAPNIAFKHLTSEIVLKFKKGKGDFGTVQDPITDNNIVEAYFDEPKDYVLKIKRAKDQSDMHEIIWNTTDFVNAYAVGEAYETNKAYPAGVLVCQDNKYYTINTAVDETNAVGQLPGQIATEVPGIVPVEDLTDAKSYSVFVTPGSETKELHIKMMDGSTNNVEIHAPQLALPTGTTNLYTAGYKYTVIVTVNGPQEIEVTATVEPWEDGGTIGGDGSIQI